MYSPGEIINKGHPLVTASTWFWLGDAARGRGNKFPNVKGSGNDGYLVIPSGTTGFPWVETDYGGGFATDIGKYVKLSTEGNVITGGPCTVLVAYLYRYDASTSGSDSETGILFSQGQNGLSLRHGTTVEALKSRVSSFVSFSESPARGQLCTAAFTADWAAAKHFTLFFNGLQVATGTSASGFGSGTTATCLGQDFGATTKEYGRHTILACAMFDSRCGNPVLHGSWIKEWDTIARKRFAPLFIQQPLVMFGPNAPVSDAVGTTTQGLGLGSSVDAQPWIRQGIGLGVQTDPEPYIRQGFALGATMAPVDLFGNVSTRMLFGSSPDADKLLTQGFGLGARFTLDAQYASLSEGFALGSKPTSDSGELANSRYRR